MSSEDQSSGKSSGPDSWVWGVAKQLCEGDRVIVDAADTTRTLTVVDEARYVDREPYRSAGLLLTLEGYGTEYTIEVPDENRPPVIKYPSGTVLGEVIHDIQPDTAGDGGGFDIVASHTASDLDIPTR